MDFTYKLPDNNAFNEVIRAAALSMPMLQENRKKIQRLLDVGQCEIIDTGKFSGRRWDARGANVNIFVPLNMYPEFGNDAIMKSSLLRICEQVLPASVGFDIVDVSISPQLNSGESRDAIEEIGTEVVNEKFLRLNDDLIGKGKQMAKAYIILYALENHLRQFIHDVLTKKIGLDYSQAISSKLRKSIENLKNQEQPRKWLPLRGDNDLYYLDFKELADLIIHNWIHFSDLFPDQAWIKVKMDDMYSIRCLIAHNSYISEEDFDLLSVTTRQILKQIS
ncbi:hypothetical protein HDR62_06520 [bacterium]|nr:hypothetical protein [bacterium]